ncbi:adenylyl-sulfate kinase [bacterium]|nr:adenylyl-sulfate kinase [bacterium]
MSKSTNIVWHQGHVNAEERSKSLKQKGAVLWFTGLSGSGKSTIASSVEKALITQGFHAYVIDGDNLRHGLNKDLSFDDKSRSENIRRVGEVAKLFCDANVITLVSLISPFRKNRDDVRAIIPQGHFFEIFVNTPIEECEKRDPKGLYQKARKGEIKDFTGISSPYEEPLKPELNLETAQLSIEECAKAVIEMLKKNKIV